MRYLHSYKPHNLGDDLFKIKHQVDVDLPPALLKHWSYSTSFMIAISHTAIWLIDVELT